MAMSAAPQPDDSKAILRGNTYFDKGTRLTISMWDFSWLFANCPGGAYENLEQRVAEAAERGYNTLRVKPSLKSLMKVLALRLSTGRKFFNGFTELMMLVHAPKVALDLAWRLLSGPSNEWEEP